MTVENRAGWAKTVTEAAGAFLAVAELCRKGEAKAADEQLTTTYKALVSTRQEIEEYIKPLPNEDPVCRELQASIDVLLEVENTLEDELGSLSPAEGDDEEADLDEAADVCEAQARLLEELSF